MVLCRPVLVSKKAGAPFSSVSKKADSLLIRSPHLPRQQQQSRAAPAKTASQTSVASSTVACSFKSSATVSGLACLRSFGNVFHATPLGIFCCPTPLATPRRQAHVDKTSSLDHALKPASRCTLRLLQIHEPVTSELLHGKTLQVVFFQVVTQLQNCHAPLPNCHWRPS